MAWRPVLRGECPVCDLDVALRKDGSVMWHHGLVVGRPCRAWVESMRPRPTEPASS